MTRPYTIGAPSQGFSFEASSHTYIDNATGEVLPSITQLLEAAGLVDSTWYSEDSRERGTAVHDLCAQFDLGSLNPAMCWSPYKPYLMAHVAAMGILKLEILAVEEPLAHPTLRYAGRPDRILSIGGVKGCYELKTGKPEPAHCVQTAAQAVLISAELNIPAEMLARFACYLKPNGRFHVERHTNRQDFDRWMKVLRECCG